MTVPADVAAYVRRSFAEGDREPALLCLAEAVDHLGHPVGPRLMRAAAVAAQGDPARLAYYIGLLKQDWRDVIVAGEYEVGDRRLVRVRDLTQPIPGPADRH